MLRFASLAAIAAVTAFAAPAGAVTTGFTIGMTGSMPDNGAYGNVLTFQTTATSGVSGAVLNAKVTGWQGSQANNAINSAYIGKYSPGLGVTGLGDNNGDGAQHQIDNAFGYWDFILVQFDRDVKLTGANLNSFQITNVSGIDNDLAIFNAAMITTAQWDSAINLASGYTFAPSTWTNYLGTGANGNRALNTSDASSKWLIGAGVNYNNNGVSTNDGFKLASISVTADVPQPPATGAVPEPATWGTMILGFALVGAAARRGRRRTATAAA